MPCQYYLLSKALTPCLVITALAPKAMYPKGVQENSLRWGKKRLQYFLAILKSPYKICFINSTPKRGTPNKAKCLHFYKETNSSVYICNRSSKNAFSAHCSRVDLCEHPSHASSTFTSVTSHDSPSNNPPWAGCWIPRAASCHCAFV